MKRYILKLALSTLCLWSLSTPVMARGSTEVIMGGTLLHVPSDLITSGSHGLINFFADIVGLDKRPSSYLTLQYEGKELYRLVGRKPQEAEDDWFISVAIQMLTDYEVKRIRRIINPWFPKTWGSPDLIVDKVEDIELYRVKYDASWNAWKLFILDPQSGAPMPQSQFDAFIGTCYSYCRVTQTLGNMDVKINFPNALSKDALTIMDNIRKDILSWEKP